jgi:coenzyme F420-reducing hydrogenase beta subunit
MRGWMADRWVDGRGVMTVQIACEMLKSGKVDAVVCVQSDKNDRSAHPWAIF